MVDQINEYLGSTKVELESSDPNLIAKSIWLGKHFKTTAYKIKALEGSTSKAVKTNLKLEAGEDGKLSMS